METNIPESKSFCCNNFANSVKEHNKHEYNIQENTRPSKNIELCKEIGKLESILGENEGGGKDDRGIRNNDEDNANKKYNEKNM